MPDGLGDADIRRIAKPDSYRTNRNTPRVEDRTSTPSESAIVLSPLSIFVYVPSNAIVEHAARVQASAGPTVSVCPESWNPPPHTLQSARVDARPLSSINV
jgi:hypothetical protein